MQIGLRPIIGEGRIEITGPHPRVCATHRAVAARFVGPGGDNAGLVNLLGETTGGVVIRVATRQHAAVGMDAGLRQPVARIIGIVHGQRRIRCGHVRQAIAAIVRQEQLPAIAVGHSAQLLLRKVIGIRQRQLFAGGVLLLLQDPVGVEGVTHPAAQMESPLIRGRFQAHCVLGAER